MAKKKVKKKVKEIKRKKKKELVPPGKLRNGGRITESVAGSVGNFIGMAMCKCQ